MLNLFLILEKKQILSIMFCFNMHTNEKCKWDPFSCTINSRIKSFQVTENVILQIIKSLYPNKVRGWNNVLIKMIQPQMTCDESITVPIKINFGTILRKGKFRETWKKANMVPFHKKKVNIFWKIIAQLAYYLPSVRFLKEKSTNCSLIIFSITKILLLPSHASY